MKISLIIVSLSAFLGAYALAATDNPDCSTAAIHSAKKYAHESIIGPADSINVGGSPLFGNIKLDRMSAKIIHSSGADSTYKVKIRECGLFGCGFLVFHVAVEGKGPVCDVVDVNYLGEAPLPSEI